MSENKQQFQTGIVICQLFWQTLDCKAVAIRQIPDTYKPKLNPYLNTNPNPTPYCVKTPVITLSCIQSKVYQNTLRL